jgi:hypothetical protein
MSRRRTTAKIFHASVKEEPKPVLAEGEAVAGEMERIADADTDQHEEAKADVKAEVLRRFLAAEAEEREASEQRTAGMFARYFKLTVAMVCLNVVIAGASVAILFRHSGETRTVVVAPAPAPVLPPAAPIAASPPATSPAATVVEVPAAAASTALPRTSPPAEKIQLLGRPAPQRRAPLYARPAGAIASSSYAPEAPYPVRAAPIPTKATPVFSARIANHDRDDPRPTERW